MLQIHPEEEVAEEEEEEETSQKGGARQSDKSNLHCTCCNKDGHDAYKCRTPWDKIEQQRNQDKGKTNDKDKGKALESTHDVLEHCNNGVTEEFFDV